MNKKQIFLASILFVATNAFGEQSTDNNLAAQNFKTLQGQITQVQQQTQQQIKQLQGIMQQQINTLNAQTQNQIKQVQTQLQGQLQQLQQQVNKLSQPKS